MGEPPIWLLDLDGVVNVQSGKPNRTIWPAERWSLSSMTVADGQSYPLLFAHPVVDFIAEVHTSGAAEVRWLTSWMNYLPELEAAIGLPPLGAPSAPEYIEGVSAYDPSAKQPWWKTAVLERTVAEGRPLVWTDDDLLWETRLRRERIKLAYSVPSLLIAPVQNAGLVQKHLRQIAEFLDFDWRDDPRRTQS